MRAEKFIFSLFFILLSVAALHVLTKPPDEVLTGRAAARDGDSIALNGENLRLEGLDAPELHQICQNNQARDYPCGRAAQLALSRLLARGVTTCIGAKRDQYGRLLVTCRINGVNIGAELVKSGHAVAFGAYEAEERFAQEDRRGLWTGQFERPEDYRRHRREAEF